MNMFWSGVPVARLGRGINPRNGFGVDLPVGIVFHVCSLMMTREKGQDKSIDTPEVTRQAYVGMLLFWELLQATKTYFDFHYHKYQTCLPIFWTLFSITDKHEFLRIDITQLITTQKSHPCSQLIHNEFGFCLLSFSTFWFRDLLMTMTRIRNMNMIEGFGGRGAVVSLLPNSTEF